MKLRLTVLSLGWLLVACQPPAISPSLSAEQLTPVQAVRRPQLAPVAYQNKIAPFAVLQPMGEQKLRVQITYPQSEAFRTQAFGCGEVASASIQVLGPGFSQPIYADGADSVTHQIPASNCEIVATLSDVPYGSLVVTIRLYDAEGNLLTGSELKGALRLIQSTQNLELSYRQMPAGRLLEQWLQGSPEERFLAGVLDITALQDKLNVLMQVSGQFPNYSFVHHPSLIHVNALKTALLNAKGNPNALNLIPAQYVHAAGSLRFQLTGYLLNQPVDVSIDDVLSPNLQLSANGLATVTNVPPGTWQMRLSGPGYLPKRVTVTVQPASQTQQGVVTILPPQPTLTAITPLTGPGGTEVTLTGTQFNATLANHQVKFGTTLATLLPSHTTTELVAVVPSGLTPGIHPITVTIGAVEPTQALDFTVTQPVVTAISPAAAQVGQGVTLTGSHFNTDSASNLVTFNGIQAEVISATATELEVEVPAGISGSVPVTVQNLQSSPSTAATFNVIPTLSAVAPASGFQGALLTLTGAGFSLVPGNNTVTIGGVSASVMAVQDTTSLSVEVPAATAGSVNVSVAVAGQSSPAQTFNLRPFISALQTSATVGDKAALIRGQDLVITGTGFSTTLLQNGVTIGGAAATVTGATATQLTVRVPDSLNTAGDQNVIVTTQTQTSNTVTAIVPSVNVTVNGGFK
jgi:preprotein translocase subunit YajC